MLAPEVPSAERWRVDEKLGIQNVCVSVNVPSRAENGAP